jgi:hypothetical protein
VQGGLGKYATLGKTAQGSCSLAAITNCAGHAKHPSLPPFPRSCPPGVSYCIKVAVVTPWDVAATFEGLPASLPRTAALLTDLATKVGALGW